MRKDPANVLLMPAKVSHSAQDDARPERSPGRQTMFSLAPRQRSG
jgi:hypothetical protein